MERSDHLANRTAGRDNYVHEQTPTVGRGRNFFDIQTRKTLVRTRFCERKIQRFLHLPAELLCLPFGVTM